MFWLSGGAVSAISGLFIAGLGVANLFPLSLALTLAAGPRQTDTANARTQLLGGLLVVSAPFLLGALADRIGLRAAFIVVPALILISAALLLAAQRAERAAARRRAHARRSDRACRYDVGQ